MVLPVLVLVVFGCLKLGMAFFTYEQVASAANAGARAAAVNHGVDPTSSCARGGEVDRADGRPHRLADRRRRTSRRPRRPGPTWSYPGTVTVTVTYPLTFSILGQLAQHFNLSATATKRLER